MPIYDGFAYKTLSQLCEDIKNRGLSLSLPDDTGILGDKVDIGSRILENSIAVHPMEGCDSEFDGSPGELTIRRYDRFSAGKAGLIWFEAVAVRHEGRANPRQLYINEKNAGSFASLAARMREIALSSTDGAYAPVIIMQLTHSGRYSKPEGKPAPVIAARNPYLDPRLGIGPDYPIITDDALMSVMDDFVKAALLAKKAGFDGVDIKSCHRYLLSELLSAHEREGRFGGAFEGRTAFLRETADRIRDAAGPDFIVTTRINIYDGLPKPYGFGSDDKGAFDPEDPVRLAAMLHEGGMEIMNMTMGNPYFNPHVNRPFEKGPYEHSEHPLEGVSRLINGIGTVQKAVPGLAVVGTGYSFLREFSANAAAGAISEGKCRIAGFGREAFAYPDFASDILSGEGMKKNKCCIACGKCSDIMRMGGMSGCVVRDAAVYGKIYRELVNAKS